MSGACMSPDSTVVQHSGLYGSCCVCAVLVTSAHWLLIVRLSVCYLAAVIKEKIIPLAAVTIVEGVVSMETDS